MPEKTQHISHITWYSSVPLQYIPNYITYVSQTSRRPTRKSRVEAQLHAIFPSSVDGSEQSASFTKRCIGNRSQAARLEASSGFHLNNRFVSAAAERLAIICSSVDARAALFTGSLRERADTHVRWATMCHNSASAT